MRIKCECGNWFLGQEDKEDTCSECLKELINPSTCDDCSIGVGCIGYEENKSAKGCTWFNLKGNEPEVVSMKVSVWKNRKPIIHKEFRKSKEKVNNRGKK